MTSIELKDIPGYETRYMASTDGRIYSKARQKFMSPRRNGDGYSHIGLYDLAGKRKCHSVHRLVVGTFIGPIAKGLQVDHINAIRDDNRLENLQIVTPKKNVQLTFDRGRKVDQKGVKNNGSVLTEADVRHICQQLVTTTRAAKAIAADVGCSRSAVNNIACAGYWREISRDYWPTKLERPGLTSKYQKRLTKAQKADIKAELTGKHGELSRLARKYGVVHCTIAKIRDSA